MKRLAHLTLILVAITACDRTPSEPLPFQSGTTLLGITSDASLFTVSSTSLPNLLRTAVLRVEAERGPASSRTLLRSWQRLNQEAQDALKAGDRQTAQNRVAAVRAEEIRIILSTLGNSAAAAVAEEVGVGLAYARLRLKAAQEIGKDVSRAAALADEVAVSLREANRALQERDYARALDAGVSASDLLDGVNRFVISLSAIRSLETMLAETMRKVTREQGPAGSAGMVRELNRLSDQARASLRSGNRMAAQQSLDAVRQEQIRLVLQVQGPGIVDVVTHGVETALRNTKERLGSLREPRLAQRAERMIAEAGSLNARAKAARNRGDAASALDLSSHAAGLLNALQLLLR